MKKTFRSKFVKDKKYQVATEHERKHAKILAQMKKYKTIVVDPPWEVKAGPGMGPYKVRDGKQVWNQAKNPSKKLPYPTMTIKELQNLTIPHEENAHLYLWTINRYVKEAYELVTYWGFKPSTLIVWAKKPRGGLGGTWSISTEYVLFARKGTLKSKRRITGTWFNWKRPYKNGYPYHSAKPKQFFDLVETVSPGPYIELFARNKRIGWDVWGNEVEKEVK